MAQNRKTTWRGFPESRVRQDPRGVRRKTGGSDREVTLLAAWAIHDAITAEMSKARLTAREHQVMLAILHHTVRYQRNLYRKPLVCSHTFLDQFANIGRQHIGGTLRRLDEAGFIRYTSGSPKQSDEGHKQTHSTIWLVVPDGWDRHLSDDGEVALVPCDSPCDSPCDLTPTTVPSWDHQQSQLGTSNSPKLGPVTVPSWDQEGSQVGTGKGPNLGFQKTGRLDSGETNAGSLGGEPNCAETKPARLRGVAAPTVALPGSMFEGQTLPETDRHMPGSVPSSRPDHSGEATTDTDPNTSLGLRPSSVEAEWADLPNVEALLNHVMRHHARDRFAERFTPARRDELLDGLERIRVEHDLGPGSMALLLGHWIAVKQGENANYAHEHCERLLRAYQPLERVLTPLGPIGALREGLRAGEEHLAERQAVKSDPWRFDLDAAPLSEDG